MVKKLIKHELIYYIRTLGLFMPLIVIVGLATRLFIFLENGSFPTMLAMFSSIAMLYVGSFAMLLIPCVVSLIRFYKNMYSAEGYLTFTLPVTNAQHIFVKLLGATTAYLSCGMAVALAVLIAISGEPLMYIFQELSNLMDIIFPVVPPVHIALFVLEVLLILFVSLLSPTLLIYACITIGQTAKKNRILLSIGVYFLYYILSQVVSTVATIFFGLVAATGAFDRIMLLVEQHPIASAHTFMLGTLLFTAAVAAAFYFITLFVMNKKLNLE